MVRAVLNRLRRCHPLTYCMTLLVGLALVLVVVPGQLCYAPHDDSPTWWEQQCKQVNKLTQKALEEAHTENSPILISQLYEHGWPRPYLVRSIGVPAFGEYYKTASKPLLTSGRMVNGFMGPSFLAHYVSWSNYDNWPLKSERWRIHPLNLALDVSIFLIAVCVVGFATERWLRSRGGLFRFRIVDLLAALTICGLLFGWIAYHARLTSIEQQVASYGTGNNPQESRLRTWKRYSGPDWLWRLVGDDAFLPFLHHTHEASYYSGATWREDFDQLVRLPRIEKLHLNLPLPFEAVQRLKDCPYLTELRITANTAYAESILKRYKLKDDVRLVTAENLDDFAMLNLRKVTLEERLFLPEDVERLLSAVPLERLHLRTLSITPEELEKLKEHHTKTAISVSWGMNGPPSGNDVTTQKVRRERAARRHD